MLIVVCHPRITDSSKHSTLICEIHWDADISHSLSPNYQCIGSKNFEKLVDVPEQYVNVENGKQLWIIISITITCNMMMRKAQAKFWDVIT